MWTCHAVWVLPVLLSLAGLSCCSAQHPFENTAAVGTADDTEPLGCGEPSRGAEALEVFADSQLLGDGVLVHRRAVLTSAHILSKANNGTRLRVVTPAGEERVVLHSEVHPGYRSRLLYNDLALLRLQEPFSATELQPLCLPDQEIVENFYGSNCTLLSGLAHTRAWQAHVVKLPRCGRLLRRSLLGPRFELHSSFICGPDPCNQESRGGSGLVCEAAARRASSFSTASAPRLVVVGVASWSVQGPCGGSYSRPGLFASTIALYRWIEDQLKQIDQTTQP